MFVDMDFMREALREALVAYEKNEVPVGCVIVKDGQIIGRGHNTRETTANPLGHAELNAIAEAAGHIGQWRLIDCQMYVTLEPCTMCTGAIIDARISKVYIGAPDKKRGAFTSYLPIIRERLLPHSVDYIYTQTISPYLISRFFRNLRQKDGSK